MQRPAVTGSARAIALTGPGPSLLVRGFWLLLAAGGCLLFVGPLTFLVADDLEAGHSVAEALWRPSHRVLTIVAAAAVAAFVAGVIAFVVTMPRTRVRREVVVEAAGLRFVEHPRWWYSGQSGRIDWADVALVSAHLYGLPPGTRGVPGTVRALAIYVRRDVSGLPAFAASAPVAESEAAVHELQTPAHRVSVAATEPYSAADVDAIAEAIGARRPDLFRAAAHVEHWYLPSEAAQTANGPDAPGATEATARQLRPAPPGTAVWLDHGHRALEVIGMILLQGAVIGGCVALMGNPFGWPDLLAAAVALILFVPLLFCCITLPVTLWLLPRFTAGVGVLVSADGLTVRRKQRWRARATVDTSIDWTQVQAVVTRHTFQLGTPTQRRRVVDVYLHDDGYAPAELPGVGVDVGLAHHTHRDFPGTPPSVTFPATRVRLGYRHDREARGRELWDQPFASGPEPRRLPADLLRPALLAFRPDVCRGFGDLWSGRSRR